MSNEIQEQTIDTLLRNVDYRKYERGFIPGKFSLEFINFIKLVNDDGKEENISPLFHYELLDSLVENKYNLCVAYRGSSKTTLIEYLTLYIALFGSLPGLPNIPLGLYVTDSMENGAKNFRSNIEYRYDSSQFLKKFIPKAKFTDKRLTFENADGHKLIWKMYGAVTGVRGVKEMGVRPYVAFLDDLMSDEEAISNAYIETINRTIYNAVIPALHPTRHKVVWIGTPFNKKDPLYRAASNPRWSTKVFPICNKFPCTRSEFVGAWEDRFPYDTVVNIYELLKSRGDTNAFNQEYLLRILSDEDRLVLDENIVWYENRQHIIDNLHKYNVYITTDFATSEKEKSDFSVISVWALDYRGVFHWIDGIVKRQDMGENIDDVFRFVDLYNPLLVGVEVSGQQKGFVSWLLREMINRNKWFNIASDKTTGEPGLRPTTSKLVRFNGVVPLFKQRRIVLPKELEKSGVMIEFKDELSSATPSGFKSLHDDCIDTISQLQLINYFIPDEHVIKEQDSVKRMENSPFSDVFKEKEYDRKQSYIV